MRMDSGHRHNGDLHAAPLPGVRLSGKPQRILVVDDNVDAAGTLAKGLSAHGHEVKTVYAAQAALQTRGG